MPDQSNYYSVLNSLLYADPVEYNAQVASDTIKIWHMANNNILGGLRFKSMTPLHRNATYVDGGFNVSSLYDFLKINYKHLLHLFIYSL